MKSVSNLRAISAFLTIPGLLVEKVGQIIVAENDETLSPVYIQLDAANPIVATTFILYADGIEIANTEDFLSGVAMWLAAFYVFNMNYPPCAAKTLEFLQRIILNITDELPPTRAVLRLTNEISMPN